MHVGMNRNAAAGETPPGRVPHARGDEPFFVASLRLWLESSPCTWG